jgi:hypothetical protein
MKMGLRIILLTVLVGLIVGCGEPTPPGGNDTGQVSSDTHGPSSDAQVDGDVSPVDTTPTVPLCKVDADCDQGNVCTCEGICLLPETNPCLTNKNCPSGQWCNPCSGYCDVEVGLCDPCISDGACGDGGACLPFASGGFHCTLACVTDAGCPVGYTCHAVDGEPDKQCIPKSADCLDLGLCENDGDCPDGNVCSDVVKECAPGCEEDDECAGDLVCTKARCVEPCTSDVACEEVGALCDNGHCKVPGTCDTSEDCPAPETYCNKTTGTCEPGCLVDGDCQDAAKVCKEKACVAKGCTHNYQCGFEQECDKASGLCLPMVGEHCNTCDASAEGQCGGGTNICVTVSDKDSDTGETVEKGDYCFQPCKDDPIDQCPQGYTCQHIQAGDIDDHFCVRSCWFDPIGG